MVMEEEEARPGELRGRDPLALALAEGDHGKALLLLLAELSRLLLAVRPREPSCRHSDCTAPSRPLMACSLVGK